MQRRRLLKIGVAATAVLVVLGGTAALLQPGLEDGALSPSGREVFSAVGRAVLEKTLPEEAGAQNIAIEGLLQRIDVLVLALPPHAQGELSQLLSLLASSAGRWGLAGLGPAWPEASVAAVQEALQGMRVSSIVLRRQAYGALHEITASAYFADEGTWPLLGYPGPLKI